MSAAGAVEPLDLQVRHFVYRFFAEHSRPPEVEETALYFALPVDEARRRYRILHDNHFFYLEPGTDSVRMANPFSSRPTDFRVAAGGKTYFANCAWDMLGIPAALGLDARIEGRCADCGDSFTLEIRNARLAPAVGIVHFLVPFKGWYEDLVFT